MGEDVHRLIAWHHEMKAVHARLRDALDVVQEALRERREIPPVEREVLLHCHGFCVALSGHHRGEDDALFPRLAELRPALAPVLAHLRQDHSMTAHLLGALRGAIEQGTSPLELQRHLDGIAAIMESHFRYEERELAGVLREVELDLDPGTAFGPL